ncbi:MAG: hypothetical protein WAT66_05315, partial [Actinomycetota bacterium]
MRQRVLVSFLTATLSMVVLLAFATTSSAAAPSTFVDHQIYISCFDPLLTDGTNFAGVSVSSSDQFGSDATIFYYRDPDTPEGDPTLSSGNAAPTLDVSATHIEATVPMFNVATGVDEGEATVTADLAPNGDPITGDKVHDGNVFYRDESVIQGLIVTAGTATMPDGVSFDLTGCLGSDDHVSVFQTNPDAFVTHTKGLILACDAETEDYSFGLFGSQDRSFGSVDIFFGTADQFLFATGPGTGTFTTQGIDWSVDMIDEASGDNIGDAVVHATFTPAGKASFEDRNSTSTRKFIADLFDVSGTVVLPTEPETTIDMSSCAAFDTRTSDVRTSPNGPQPGGRAPSNDQPSGAITLVPGRTITLQTRGASEAPEAPCVEDTPGGPEEQPIANTVWYK